MNPFPGQGYVTVNTSGVGGPTVVVSSGASDPNGSWPTPSEATGNDLRTAANAMAMGEALTDRTNWLARRTPDPIAGGDYRTAHKGSVESAIVLTLDRSAISGDTNQCLTVVGAPAASYVATITASTSSNATALGAYGYGTGSGVLGYSGNTTGFGAGVVGIGFYHSNNSGGNFIGDGSGPGLLATSVTGVGAEITGGNGQAGVKSVAGSGTGSAAMWASGGPLYVDTNVGSPTTTPGPNRLWADNIPKSFGLLTWPGGTAFVAIAGGFNVSSAVITGSELTVTFETAMANTNYVAMCTMQDANNNSYLLVTSETNSSSVNFNLPGMLTYSSSSLTAPFTYRFHVFGQQ